jgi:hypothetical protein
MKHYHFIKTKDTYKQRFNTGNVSQVVAEHLYDDSEDSWREKSIRLQARRWRKIKNQMV